jgi:ABC-2 type transport system permease protein
VELPFYTASGDTNAAAARQAVLAALGAVGRSYFAAEIVVSAAEEARPFADSAKRASFVDAVRRKAKDLFADAPARIAVSDAVSANAEEAAFWSPASQASAGQLITWVFLPLLGIAEIFAAERTLGTLRRTVSAPVSKAVMLLGTIAGQLLVALAQMGILAAAGVLLLGLGWFRDLPATLTMFLAFGLAAVAFGTMLGTFVRTPGQASGLSVALGMVMALLSGCWYPRELFPPLVQNLSLALPTSWAMIGLNDILLRQQGLWDVLPEAGALLGFAAVFFLVGVMRYRYE